MINREVCALLRVLVTKMRAPMVIAIVVVIVNYYRLLFNNHRPLDVDGALDIYWPFNYNSPVVAIAAAIAVSAAIQETAQNSNFPDVAPGQSASATSVMSASIVALVVRVTIAVAVIAARAMVRARATTASERRNRNKNKYYYDNNSKELFHTSSFALYWAFFVVLFFVTPNLTKNLILGKFGSAILLQFLRN